MHDPPASSRVPSVASPSSSSHAPSAQLLPQIVYEARNFTVLDGPTNNGTIRTPPVHPERTPPSTLLLPSSRTVLPPTKVSQRSGRWRGRKSIRSLPATPTRGHKRPLCRPGDNYRIFYGTPGPSGSHDGRTKTPEGQRHKQSPFTGLFLQLCGREERNLHEKVAAPEAAFVLLLLPSPPCTTTVPRSLRTFFTCVPSVSSSR